MRRIRSNTGGHSIRVGQDLDRWLLLFHANKNPFSSSPPPAASFRLYYFAPYFFLISDAAAAAVVVDENNERADSRLVCCGGLFFLVSVFGVIFLGEFGWGCARACS